MMRSRKAFMYTLILGVIGFVILMLRLWSNMNSVSADESMIMGQSSFETLHALHSREVALQYFDVGSQHAAYDAVTDLFWNGGWFNDTCGAFGTADIWYDRGARCFPSETSLSTELSAWMQYDYYARQVAKNPYYQGQKDPRDFIYYSDIGDATSIEGHSTRPLLMVIMCNTPKKSKPVGFGLSANGKYPWWTLPFGQWAVEQQSYACGQIALRPDFRDVMNVSTISVARLADDVQQLLVSSKCDGDVSPDTCLKDMKKGNWTVTVSQDLGPDGKMVGATAIYAVPIGGPLPGYVDPPTARFAVRVKKGAVAP